MDITLSPGAHLQWRCPRPIELQICGGRLWLTVAGDAHDRFLEAGERVCLPPHRAATLGAEGAEPLRLRGDLVAATAPVDRLDLRAYRRRVRRQRAVAGRWWRRELLRRWRGWLSAGRPG
jgi:hypothetical protein